MPSFAKKQKRYPDRPRHEVTRFTAGREIGIVELRDVLGLDTKTLRTIVGAPDFPRALGRRAQSKIWVAAEVIAWLESKGWREDAEALRRWPSG
jgi:hypothetical protein